MKMDVNPADLRFTEDSIVSHLRGPHHYVDVRNAVKMIHKGTLTASDFQKFLRVVKYKEHWWALDNRRLWVFRNAECPLIKVEVVPRRSPLSKAVTKVLSDPATYTKLSSPLFLPTIRLGHTVQTEEETSLRSCLKAAQVQKPEGSPAGCHTLTMDLSPVDLRFTSESIVIHPQEPHHHVDLLEAVEMIRQRKLTASDFQNFVRAVNHKEHWWALDNRRLWVFRAAECPSITVEVIRKKSALGKAVTKILSDPATYTKLSSSLFLPMIRESKGLMVHSEEDGHSPDSFRAGIQIADSDSKALLLKENSGPLEVIPMTADANENASDSITATAGPIDVKVPHVYVDCTDRNLHGSDRETPVLPRAIAITRNLSRYYPMIATGTNGWQGYVAQHRARDVEEDLTFQQSPHSNPSSFSLPSGLQKDEISASGCGIPPGTMDEGARGRYLRPMFICLKYLILLCTSCEWKSA